MNLRKVAIIGCGFVGSSIAFALMQSKLYSEMVLIDVNKAKAEGERIYQGSAERMMISLIEAV